MWHCLWLNTQPFNFQPSTVFYIYSFYIFHLRFVCVCFCVSLCFMSFNFNFNSYFKSNFILFLATIHLPRDIQPFYPIYQNNLIFFYHQISHCVVSNFWSLFFFSRVFITQWIPTQHPYHTHPLTGSLLSRLDIRLLILIRIYHHQKNNWNEPNEL